MRKVTGILAAFAVIAILMMILSLMMGMDTLAGSPVADRVKLALEIQKQYGFERVTSDAPVTTTELVFTVHVQVPRGAARATPADEDEARRLYALGRVDMNLRRAEDAEARFKELRERYPNTSAYIDWRLWQIAAFIQRNYHGSDLMKIGKITVKQRTTRGSGAGKIVDDRPFTLDTGIPRESP